MFGNRYLKQRLVNVVYVVDPRHGAAKLGENLNVRHGWLTFS